MKRTTIFLDEAVERELDAMSERERRPKASLVREAISEYLARKGGRGDLPRFTAVGASGRRDGAASHEEELFEDLEPHGEAGPKAPAGSRDGQGKRA